VQIAVAADSALAAAAAAAAATVVAAAAAAAAVAVRIVSALMMPLAAVRQAAGEAVLLPSLVDSVAGSGRGALPVDREEEAQWYSGLVAWVCNGACLAACRSHRDRSVIDPSRSHRTRGGGLGAFWPRPSHRRWPHGMTSRRI
jgi:hypothetical protein